MTTSIEVRLDDLEQKIADLTRLVTPPAERDKDWRRTVGMSVNDREFDEIARLGQEYRKAQRWETEPDADPGH